jgi:hypothetical protein
MFLYFLLKLKDCVYRHVLALPETVIIRDSSSLVWLNRLGLGKTFEDPAVVRCNWGGYFMVLDESRKER